MNKNIFIIICLALVTNGCSDGCKPSDAKKEQLPTDFCIYLDENECKASGSCTYNEKSKACTVADPSIKDTCTAYQSHRACIDDIRCEWIEGATPSCRSKTKGEPHAK